MKTKHTLMYTLAMLFCMATTGVSAHWTTKGPYGGKVKCLYAADTLVYIGSADGGVYRSNSAAVTSWRYANYTGLSNGQINAITQSGTFVVAGTPAGIFRSGDIGATWTASNSGLTNTHVLALAVGEHHLLAGTNGGGVFMSHDNGVTWEEANVGLTSNVVNCFAFDGTNLYAGTAGGGVFVSTDDGESWSAMNTGLGVMHITALTVSGGNLFAGTASGVFYTGTSTVAWTGASTGLGSTVINALTAAGGTIYAATDAGVYTSPDAVPAWTAAGTGYNGVTTAVAVFGGKLYLGTPGNGIYRSTSLSSVSWSAFNTGYNNLEGYAVYNNGLLVIAATNKGLFVSRDLAASYMASNNGLTDSLHVTSLVFSGSDLYITTQNAGVFMSTDTGAHWMPVNTGLSTLNLRHIMATSTHLLAAADNGTVFSTPLSAINWTTCTGLPGSLDITAMATDGPTHVFLGTMGNGVYMSMDFSSWMPLNTGLTDMNVTSLAVKGAHVYAGTMGSGIFRNGFMSPSWTAVNTGLVDLHITALYASGMYVVAGYKGGVSASYNDGAAWQETSVVDYLPEFDEVKAISFGPASTRIFAATPHNVFYSNSMSEMPVGIDEIGDAANLFSLWPNPCGRNLSIRLNNRQAGMEQVNIMDLSGKSIGLVQANGANALEIPVDLPAGIYLVKITTGSGSAAQKLVIE